MVYNPSFNLDPRGTFPPHVHDSFISVVGGTNAKLLENELNELQWIQVESRAALIRRTVPSGVWEFLAGQNVPSNVGYLGVGPGTTSNFNTFFAQGFKLNMHGFKLSVMGNGQTTTTDDLNLIFVPTPPSANSLALPGSARDDLVILEAWFEEFGGYMGPIDEYGGISSPQLPNDLIDPRVNQETTRRVQLQWRIRTVSGVDFTTWPEGMKTRGTPWTSNGAVVTPQGAFSVPINLNPNELVITQYHQLDPNIDLNFNDLADVGLFIAGDGSNTAITTLGTFDGYIYALPLFRVRRRNTQGWNPNSNPLGGRGYPGNMIVAQAVTAGATTIYVQAVDPNLQVGDYVNLWGNVGQVTAINPTSNYITVNQPAYAAATGATLAIVSAASDRPDGLFNNIVDATDIMDLRHWIGVNHNWEALTSQNMDLLMKGALKTKLDNNYDRVFSGLQPFADDINTLLLCHFDNSLNGTSNGVVVTPSSAPGIATPAFGPGIAGEGFYIPSDTPGANVGVLYDVANFNPSTSPFTVELFFKPGSWGGIASANQDTRTLFALFDQGNNEILSVARGNLNAAANGFAITYVNASGTTQYLSDLNNTLTPYLNAGGWHYLILTNNPISNSLTFQVDELSFTSTALPMESTNIATCLVGDPQGYGDVTVDEFRLSNIVRAITPLPTGYSFLRGDRLINGPNNTSFHIADDAPVPSGVPLNAMGMGYVPVLAYSPAWLNNTQLRHYEDLGVTPGWFVANNGWTNNVGEAALPDGRIDSSAEWQQLSTMANGSTSTLEFTLPANRDGKFLLPGATFLNLIQVGSTNVTPTAINLNNSVLQVTLPTTPTNGETVSLLAYAGANHVHYIPSTRGFEVHVWESDSTTVQYLANPTTAPTVAGVNLSGGTLSSGTSYYVRYTYTTPYGETLPSPEGSITLLGGDNALSVTAAALPTGATSVKWYLSTASDVETYNSTSTTNATNIVALSSAGAAAMPTSSTSQLNSHTFALTQDTTAGQVNVINQVRVTLPSTLGSWLVPKGGYITTTTGGPNADIPSWDVTTASGAAVTLPTNDIGITWSGNLPIGAVVEIYYEYVYVPQVGDELELYVKHTVNQGFLQGQMQVHELINGQLLSDIRFLATTEGSGKVDSLIQVGNIYRLNRLGPVVTNLPLAPNQNIAGMLTGASLASGITVMTDFTNMRYVGNSVPYNGNSYDNPWYVPGRQVVSISTSTTVPANPTFKLNGEPDLTDEGRADYVIHNQLPTSLSSLGAMYALVRDNGRVRLAVATTYNESASVGISTGFDSYGATNNANIYELVGRPLVIEDFNC